MNYNEIIYFLFCFSLMFIFFSNSDFYACGYWLHGISIANFFEPNITSAAFFFIFIVVHPYLSLHLIICIHKAIEQQTLRRRIITSHDAPPTHLPSYLVLPDPPVAVPEELFSSLPSETESLAGNISIVSHISICLGQLLWWVMLMIASGIVFLSSMICNNINFVCQTGHTQNNCATVIYCDETCGFIENISICYHAV